MSPEDIQRVLHQRPFQPFRVELSNGDVYVVRHPELVIVGRTSMVIGQPAPDLPETIYSNFDIISLLHINTIKPVSREAPPVAN